MEALRHKDVLCPLSSLVTGSTVKQLTHHRRRLPSTSPATITMRALLRDIKHPEREWAYEGQRDWTTSFTWAPGSSRQRRPTPPASRRRGTSSRLKASSDVKEILSRLDGLEQTIRADIRDTVTPKSQPRGKNSCANRVCGEDLGSRIACFRVVVVQFTKLRFTFKRMNALCSGTVSRFNEQLPSPRLLERSIPHGWF